MRVFGDPVDRREQFVALVFERTDDLGEAALAFARQPDPGSTSVHVAGLAHNEAGVLSSAHRAGDRVRLDAQALGDVVDRCSLVSAWSALDHQQQEVSLRRQTRGPRRFLGGILERPQGGAKVRDGNVIRLLFGRSHCEVLCSYYEMIPGGP